MRGIQISDSLPIDDRNMMLTLKTDSAVNGQTHAINLCRECVAPGTRIRFALTLDQSILKGRWTADSILEGHQRPSRRIRMQAVCRPEFTAAAATASKPAGRNLLMLGGGVGFFSKSLAYPYLGEGKGLRHGRAESAQPGLSGTTTTSATVALGDLSAHAEIRPISGKDCMRMGLVK